MGFLNDLFGDEAARADMLRAERRRFEKNMLENYLPLFESRMTDLIAQVEADQQTDIAALTAAFQEQRDTFDQMVTQNMERGFDEAAELLSQSFGQELKDIERASEAASTRSIAQGALTGLGMTSFGQAQTEAIRQEGQRDQTRAKQQFAQQGMQLALNRAGAMADVGQAQIGLIGQQAGIMSDTRRAYTSAISGLGQTLATQTLGSQTGVAQAGLDVGMSLANNIGTGFNLGGALVGAGMQALTGGLMPTGGGQ